MIVQRPSSVQHPFDVQHPLRAGWTAVWLMCIIGVSISEARAADLGVDFNRDIKPILSNVCFKCHGPDPDQRKGGADGLRLDTAEGTLADLGGYAAVVPGKPEESALVQRIASTDPEEVMPPKSSGKTLTPREVQLLTDWVKQGGKYAQHWSYVKPVRPDVPEVVEAAWPRNDVDRFILARLEREGLRPSVEADRYALVRRLSLDLTGLPPTIAEVEAFVNDSAADAYEQLVERLLRQESYGEHFAHMWLDLARYADSAGYADDPPRIAWLFRDYVIRSLNANKPFDQFTIEQIAGDLLPEPGDDQLIATAFHRNTLTNNEGGTNDEEFRNVAVVDRVNTTMAVWMGTTIACAQCHSHKYDPITQEEYFRFFAIFNSSEDADRRDESPLFSFFTPEQKQQRSAWEAEFAKLEATLQTATPELETAQAEWDRTFPRDLKWQALKPESFASQAGVAGTIADDGAVLVAKSEKNDTYTVTLPLEAGKLQALRLEALPDAALPAQGPGHSGGNFILSRVSATIIPAATTSKTGQFLRIELPGKEKMLSLAEVQVFQGAENLALKGEARQSSTDYEGEAKRAIDGNTDGRFQEAQSTTHTQATDDPWWEVDLRSELPIERVVIWNRTDTGTPERLKEFRVSLLDGLREPVWNQVVSAVPTPSVNLPLGGGQPIAFTVAVADGVVTGLEPTHVLDNKDPKQKGWAGGQPGVAHSLTLTTAAAVEIPAGSKLSVTLEHAATQPNQTLGRFRLSIADDARAAEWGRTPPDVLAALSTAAGERTAPQKEATAKYFRGIAPQLDATRKRLAEVRQQLSGLQPATVPIMRELPDAQRRVTKIQHRGNYLELGAEVTPGTPAAFPPLPSGAVANRLSLARWLVDAENPLTGRVIANRYWEQLFGTGIVATSEEFGAQGDQPFHPELLDWLATELVRAKWDTKAFVRLLVTSAAYRQSSRVTPELQHLDPDNRLLARGPRFRLSAETVRDQALFAGGLLSPKMYGLPVKPPQPATGLNAAFGPGIDWQTSMGEDRYRRALYTTWRRSNPYPSMTTFDAPNREVCTVRRGRTNTPLQALVTLNDPVFVEAAQALARRIVSQGGATLPERVQYGFRICLSRPPHPAEAERLSKLFEQTRAGFETQPEAAQKMAAEPLGPVPADMNVAELAAWTVVGNVLLNLDETLMKR